MRHIMGSSGPLGPRVRSACRKAPVSGWSTSPARARPAPQRCSSGWSAPASGCSASSSTTRAGPTRILPSLPTRSTPCATSGTDNHRTRKNSTPFGFGVLFLIEREKALPGETAEPFRGMEKSVWEKSMEGATGRQRGFGRKPCLQHPGRRGGAVLCTACTGCRAT